MKKTKNPERMELEKKSLDLLEFIDNMFERKSVYKIIKAPNEEDLNNQYIEFQSHFSFGSPKLNGVAYIKSKEFKIHLNDNTQYYFLIIEYEKWMLKKEFSQSDYEAYKKESEELLSKLRS